MDQRKTGEYKKFHIHRNDGRDHPGGDRRDADYFVLDLTYDKYAEFALLAYAEVCEAEYPLLAADLFKKVYHPNYPFIYKACFAVTLDNGGLNREREEPTIKEEYADFIATFAARHQGTYDLDEINHWFKSLNKEDMDIATAGEETERGRLMDNAPDGADHLLNDWFEEHC